ncbi:ComEA family DNA-binding protein [Actinomadura formosensis]|uniref:ComEA family DNA-binding protein n=1 Tax=Actinomadura formosensis TaxID=60706 RepID=UPI0008355577|nr:helix-hairpin-helix domain-containing protein [Actinomadura formosensis]
MSHHADRPFDPESGRLPMPERPYPGAPYPGPSYPGAPYPGAPYPGHAQPGHTQPSRRPPPRAFGPAGGRPPYPGPPAPPPPASPPLPPPSAESANDVLWAFVPFITLGYGTPFAFLYAAIRRGSWGLGAVAAGYGIGTAGVLTLMQSGDPLLTVLGAFLAIMLWLAGTGHAFAVRTSVFPREAPRNRQNEHAIQIAKYRRTLRAEARALAAEDPALARELRIGRPDEPRTYDDGGLVDVNHAPREIIEKLPGMTPEMAGRVIRRREEHGGFVSAEEMAVDADIPPDVLPLMADYTIFLK